VLVRDPSLKVLAEIAFVDILRKEKKMAGAKSYKGL